MAAKYVIEKSKNGKLHFNLKAGNGEVILSSQLYESLASAKNGVASCQKNGAEDARFERLEAKDGQFYFNLVATNGQVIGKSEMYKAAASRDKGIESVKKNASTDVIEDKTGEPA